MTRTITITTERIRRVIVRYLRSPGDARVGSPEVNSSPQECRALNRVPTEEGIEDKERNDMKKIIAAFVFTLIVALPAYPQDPVCAPSAALDPPGRNLNRALTAGEKEAILRGGVLTLFGRSLMALTPEERQRFAADVKASSATYLRWLGYFYTGVQASRAAARTTPPSGTSTSPCMATSRGGFIV